MRPGTFRALSAAWLLTLACAIGAHAQQPVICDSQQRAGYPQLIAPWARPSDSGGHVGYLIGGGALRYHKGELPNPDDGTWGWDYAGRWFPRRVILLWWHGRHSQGGTGSYRTDGPQVLHPLRDADH